MSSSQLFRLQTLFSKYERTILALFGVIAVVFATLRLVNLRADMPSYITWSNTLFTDEGIYARNAFWFVSTGNWYIQADYNSAINYPIYFVLQVIAFKLFGTNFESIRALSALSAFTIIGVVGFLVWHRAGNRAALITILTISTNFLFFGFSRYGQADMPMLLLVVLSLAVLLMGNKTPNLFLTGVSGFILLLALLTKTSAAFAVPVLFLLVWQQHKSWKARLTHAAVLLSVLGLGFILYRIFLVAPYSADYQEVYAPLTKRFRFGVQDLILQFWKQIRVGQSVIGSMLYALAILTGTILFIFSKGLRDNLLFRTALYWIIFGFLMLSTTYYQPPRYFSHLVIPFGIILGLGIDHLLISQKLRWIGYFILGMIIIVNLQGGMKIVNYISSPQYSMLEMGNDIRQQAELDGVKSPLLIGNIAGNVSLANGMLSVGAMFNDKLMPDSDSILELYIPNYFVSQGAANPKIEQSFQKAGFQLEYIRKYDVLNNYRGSQVYLYRVIKIGQDKS